MVCWIPATPTLAPQDGIGPSTPALVFVFTNEASARISPVLTSMTTATPLNALVAAIWRARSCSVTYCSDVSSVNSRPTPGLALRITVVNELGRLTPEDEVNSRVSPA